MSRSLLKIAFSLVVLLAFPLPVLAATTVSIKESQVLTFPTMGIPSFGSANLTISPLNSSTSGYAEIISGMASRGVYPLSSQGEGGISISIDISDINTGNAGLVLNNFRGFYNGQTIDSFPSSTLQLPANEPSNTPLYLGATVTADHTITAGNYTASFSITVFVQ